jgi:hypothetical protein
VPGAYHLGAANSLLGAVNLLPKGSLSPLRLMVAAKFAWSRPALLAMIMIYPILYI